MKAKKIVLHLATLLAVCLIVPTHAGKCTPSACAPKTDERCGCNKPKPTKDAPESATDVVAQDDERCGCNKPKPKSADCQESVRCSCGCSKDCACDKKGDPCKTEERCGCNKPKPSKDACEPTAAVIVKDDERCGCNQPKPSEVVTPTEKADQERCATVTVAGKALVNSCCK